MPPHTLESSPTPNDMPPATATVEDRLASEYRRLRVTGRSLLAVSGGADSVALFRATLKIADSLALLPIVAHLDHALRPESAADAAWVGDLARSQNVEFLTERLDVRSAAAHAGRGLEETARSLRYDFLRNAAESCGASFVATAHTADDQTETILFNLLRGSGLQGLRGIARRRSLSDRVTLVRPLLDMTRPAVEQYLASLHQPFLNDPSNTDPAFTRNRLRHDLLPQLRESINPALDESLRRLSRQAADASALIARLARRELAASNVESSAETIRLRTRRLRTRPRVLIRETISLAWRRAEWPRQAMGFDHWDALAGIVLDGGRRTLPGGTDARRRRGELILKRPPH